MEVRGLANRSEGLGARQAQRPVDGGEGLASRSEGLGPG